MRAGAERLERETLRRDSKLWTCRRAAAALCEFAIAQCPALFLSECETASIQKISGRFEFAFRARRRRCASTRQRRQRRMHAAQLLTAWKRSFGALANARA